jgi:tripartite-type tricarboxylate transporter receptor subunit TctC
VSSSPITPATQSSKTGGLQKKSPAGLADPKLKARLADLGGIVMMGSPADFAKFIAEETGKWAKVIKSAGIKPN